MHHLKKVTNFCLYMRYADHKKTLDKYVIVVMLLLCHCHDIVVMVADMLLWLLSCGCYHVIVVGIMLWFLLLF